MTTSFNPLKSFAKALAIGIVAMAVCFFLGVFLGIIGLAISALFIHHMPDYTIAYRIVGLSLALFGLVTAFFASLVRDFRRIS